MEKDLSNCLKERVKENGAIQVDDLVYGSTPLVSYTLDAQQIVQIMLDAGLSRDEIWPLLTITRTHLEKGLKRLRRKDILIIALSTGANKDL
jgi:hypothetical protein